MGERQILPRHTKSMEVGVIIRAPLNPQWGERKQKIKNQCINCDIKAPFWD